MQAPPYEAGPFARRGERYSLRNPFLRLRVALLILLMLVIIGTGGYHLIEGLNPLDSLYMTIITLATVGYRELSPPTPGGKIFTLALILCGVTTSAWALQALFQTLLSEELGGTVSHRRMRRRIDALSGHYIICGYGRMGRHVANELGLKGLPFVVVDPSDEVAEELAETALAWVKGDAREDSTLREAGVDRAAGLITVAPSDADNVFITLTARGLNPRLDIVARSVYLENEPKLRRAGADRVVSPYRIGGRRMAAAVISPNVIEFLEAALYNPEVNLEWAEMRISAGSGFIGQRIVDARFRKRFGVIVVGLRRGEAIMAVGPDEEVAEGDVLIVLGAPGQVKQFALACGGEWEEASI